MRFKCYGIRYGKKFYSAGKIILDIVPNSQVIIGNNVSIISDSRRCSSSSLGFSSKLRTFSKTSRIIIEDNVGLNGTSITSRSKSIIIGKNTKIAPNVIIVDSDFHNPWPPLMRHSYPGDEVDGDIIIGSNCWIGMNSIILKGVQIGDNSVIAAGCVVTRAIPPNSLAGGVPARVIKIYPDCKQ